VLGAHSQRDHPELAGGCIAYQWSTMTGRQYARLQPGDN
jgi:hypothetical protein